MKVEVEFVLKNGRSFSGVQEFTEKINEGFNDIEKTLKESFLNDRLGYIAWSDLDLATALIRTQDISAMIIRQIDK